MKVVENTITDYRTANFSETETAWSGGALYNYRDEARDGHYIYAYASQEENSNTTLSPEADIALNSSDYTARWSRVRPSNYYSMLDDKTGTQTENPDTIEIELTNDNYDAFALLEVDAKSVTLELIDIATSIVITTIEIDLSDNSNVIDEYSYWFAPILLRRNIYVDYLPFVSNTKLKVTIDNTGSIAKCGRLVYGQAYYVGETSYDADLDIESYSRDETDIFGNVDLIQIGSVGINSYNIKFATENTPYLVQKRKDLDKKAVLFIADESATSNTQNLLSFGYWQRFKLGIKNPRKSEALITIKEVL